MLAVVFRAEQFRSYVHGRHFTIKSDHKPLESITKKSLADTSAWLQQCYYACKGMIMFFTTALERKWTSQIHFHISSPNLARRLYWILPSTMPPCPLPERKTSEWLLRWMLRCLPCLISSSLAGLMISRKSHTHYVPTGNTVSHLLLKMDLCFMEKPSSSLRQKGRRSLVPFTNHTKALPKTQLLACGCVFWPGINKAIEDAVQQCETCMRFQTKNAATLLIPTPTPSCSGRYVHQTSSHWMVWITSSLLISILR